MEDLYKKVEEYLKNQPKIVFDGIGQFNVFTTEEAVSLFFKYSKSYMTLKQENTGWEKYCHTRRRRTIGDIYRIIFSYKPELANLKDIQDALLALIDKEGLRTMICPDINKRVWNYSFFSGYSGHFYHKPVDEFGLTYDISKLKTPNVNYLQSENYLYYLNL